MNCFEAKQIPLVDFLEDNGYVAVRKDNNNNHWYLSPFRTEKDPSFRVNVKMNVWYDYGLGEGGTIIDLGMKLHNCNVENFLEILSENKIPTNKIQGKNQLESPLKVLAVNSLANNALLNYLKERGITANISKKYCKEVYYEIDSKKYFAVGFPNRNGGYELRNSFYKGCISPKDISIFSESHPIVCVFEGFIDFLSFFMLKIDLPINTDYVILNSVAFLQKSLEVLVNYEKLYVFFDNDASGKSAFSVMQQSFGIDRTIDMSKKYSAHKDLNDYLINLTSKLEVKSSKGNGMGM